MPTNSMDLCRTGAGAGLDPQASWPIELMAGGNANSLSNLGNVGTAKEVDGTYSFVVPSDLPPGTTYAVRMGEHYSHQFTVGPPGSGSPNPTTTAANGAPSVANRNATGLQANSTQLLVNSTNSTTNSTLKPTTTTPLPTTPPSPTPSPGTLPLNPNIGMSGAMALPLNHVSSYAMVAPLLALVYLIDA